MHGLLTALCKALGPALKIALQIAGATTIILLAQTIDKATKEWAVQELGFDPWKK